MVGYERRVGYACTNTALGRRIRTTRLANATRERVAELGRENLDTVQAMAAWNVDHGIRMMRISSDIVPLAGHPRIDPRWRDDLAEAFRETGRVLRSLDQRVSAHPGQYTVLSSPRAEVVERAVADLEAQATWFDLMRVPADLVIHLGGGFGDPAAAVERFIAVANSLRETVLKKLVVENDDRIHAIRAALHASEQTGLPVVFDAFHHEILTDPGIPDSHDALRRALATWPRGRTPKIHWSDPAPGRRPGAHGDRVDPARLRAYLAHHPPAGEVFDIMLEAKHKEQAVLDVLESTETITETVTVPTGD